MSVFRRRILASYRNVISKKEKVIFENKTINSSSSFSSTGVIGAFADMSVLVRDHYYRVTFDYEYTVTSEEVADAGVDITVRGGYWSSYNVIMKNYSVVKNEHSSGHIDCIIKCLRNGGTNRVLELITSSTGHKGNVTFKVTNMRFSDCTDGIDVYPNVFFATSGYKCAPSADSDVLNGFYFRSFAEQGVAVPVKIFGTIKCHIKNESTSKHYPRFVSNYRGFINQYRLGGVNIEVVPEDEKDILVTNKNGGDDDVTYDESDYAGAGFYWGLGSASGMVATWSNFEFGEFSIIRA